jgi:hypothetical protein
MRGCGGRVLLSFYSGPLRNPASPSGSTPLIPFGGGTSLEDHVAVLHGGISLDSSHLNGILQVNADDFDATVEAVVTLEQLNERYARDQRGRSTPTISSIRARSCAYSLRSRFPPLPPGAGFRSKMESLKLEL